MFYVSGLPSKSFLSQCCFASWAVIAVYRFTSGYPEPSRPGPSCSSTLKLCTWPKFGPLILLSNYLSLKIRYSRLFWTLNYFKPEVYSCTVVKLVELGLLANFEPSQMTHLVILDLKKILRCTWTSLQKASYAKYVPPTHLRKIILEGWKKLNRKVICHWWRFYNFWGIRKFWRLNNFRRKNSWGLKIFRIF